MARFFVVLWIIGLCTGVPYGTYYLFFEASRDQYALLIVSVLFWIFGYWGVVGPLLSAIKIFRIQRAFDKLQNHEELKQLLQHEETQETAVDLIVAENKVPRFVARRIVRLLTKALADNNDGQTE